MHTSTTPKESFAGRILPMVERAEKFLGLAPTHLLNPEYADTLRLALEGSTRNECMINLVGTLQTFNRPDLNITPRVSKDAGKLEDRHYRFMAAFIIQNGRKLIEKLSTSEAYDDDALFSLGGLFERYADLQTFHIALNLPAVEKAKAAKAGQNSHAHTKLLNDLIVSFVKDDPEISAKDLKKKLRAEAGEGVIVEFNDEDGDYFFLDAAGKEHSQKVSGIEDKLSKLRKKNSL